MISIFTRGTWNPMTWDGLVQPSGKYLLKLINNSLSQLQITACIPHHVHVFGYPTKSSIPLSRESGIYHYNMRNDNLHKINEYLLLSKMALQSANNWVQRTWRIALPRRIVYFLNELRQPLVETARRHICNGRVQSLYSSFKVFRGKKVAGFRSTGFHWSIHR